MCSDFVFSLLKHMHHLQACVDVAVNLVDCIWIKDCSLWCCPHKYTHSLARSLARSLTHSLTQCCALGIVLPTFAH